MDLEFVRSITAVKEKPSPCKADASHLLHSRAKNTMDLHCLSKMSIKKNTTFCVFGSAYKEPTPIGFEILLKSVLHDDVKVNLLV